MMRPRTNSIRRKRLRHEAESGGGSAPTDSLAHVDYRTQVGYINGVAVDFTDTFYTGGEDTALSATYGLTNNGEATGELDLPDAIADIILGQSSKTLVIGFQRSGAGNDALLYLVTTGGIFQTTQLRSDGKLEWTSQDGAPDTELVTTGTIANDTEGWIAVAWDGAGHIRFSALNEAVKTATPITAPFGGDITTDEFQIPLRDGNAGITTVTVFDGYADAARVRSLGSVGPYNADPPA